MRSPPCSWARTSVTQRERHFSILMIDRLPTHLEVAGLIRTVQAGGGNAAVLRRGDAERGALVLILVQRGEFFGCFERVFDLQEHLMWVESAPAPGKETGKVANFLADRARFDADFWALELDIPDAQRFVAEMLPTG